MAVRYRLALDLGTTSIGWAILRLNDENDPTAIIRTGVRIFSDGRNPKDGSSLAVNRRLARSMRRRRDRALSRKRKMKALLQDHNLFPKNNSDCKALEKLNPYQLRAQALDQRLEPHHFGRAIFHIAQRRGFKSNRRADKANDDSGLIKTAISRVDEQIDSSSGGNCPRTVGELLWHRLRAGQTVRARYRETRTPLSNGKHKLHKSYDLYFDRRMVEEEFDLLWKVQAGFDPGRYPNSLRDKLKDCLLFQRRLRPATPGRCTLEPEHPRAPVALPSQQLFRIYQDVNHLRLLDAGLQTIPLTIEQRDKIVSALIRKKKLTFHQIKKLLGLPGNTMFAGEDDLRTEIKGHTSNVILSAAGMFGSEWFEKSLTEQDRIVQQLLTMESTVQLIAWLSQYCAIKESAALAIANSRLPAGYANLSIEALKRVLPELAADVVPYSEAVKRAGYAHHSALDHFRQTGECLNSLPYYGEYLQRHVAFGTGETSDTPEKRYGKIANPTVHIGLNQVRIVVNELIKEYGLPTEVIIEVARDLKMSREAKARASAIQVENKKRNDRLRSLAAGVLGLAEEHVSGDDIQRLILWEELSFDVADRRCPYSGVQISAAMALSDAVEVEHILPFSRTLDDSLNNKTLSTRKANRIKGNRTPAEAASEFEHEGWMLEDILARAGSMPKNKRFRFAVDGYDQWLRDHRDFLARALNDTRYLSRIAREYLELICPTGTRVIPGQMTAMLRGYFGLNSVLGLSGRKNRNDHRHHAVDACVIGITDQNMLKRFAKASASARSRQLDRLVDAMPLPWPTFRDHVVRSTRHIKVSHKPDHSHEGAMHKDTAYGLRDDGYVITTKMIDGRRVRVTEKLKVIPMTCSKAASRHGLNEDGSPRAYKGYKGDSNYCIEIVLNEKGAWKGEVISTYQAYQTIRSRGPLALKTTKTSFSGKPLIMRLMLNDTLSLNHNGEKRLVRVVTIKSSGQLLMADVREANSDARNRDSSESFKYISKSASTLRGSDARQVTISPAGKLRIHPLPELPR